MFQILGEALGFLSIKDSLHFMSRYYHVKLISELNNGFPHLVVAIVCLLLSIQVLFMADRRVET